MFSAMKADFESRVREVDLYFQLLIAMENGELAIVGGVGPQNLPIGEIPSDCDSMLKGAGYLVLYNLVEAFIRRGFQAVFDTIQTDQLRATELSKELQEQWVMQRNRKINTFDGSPKLYMQVAIDIINEIVDKRTVRLHRDQLGGSGNLDADAIRKLCRSHGISPDTSSAAHGGASLTIVKRKRNSLAHGDESFVECGRHTTAPGLKDTKDEVVQFIREILDNLESFSADQKYRKAWQ